MENLSKSLQALDSAADELLKKSNSDDKEDIKPDDVSEDSSSDDKKDDDKDVEKGCTGNMCDPDGDNLKKSEPDAAETEEVKKSLENFQEDVKDSFNADEDISKGVDTSEFQAALVTSTVKALGEMQYDLYNNQKNSAKATDVLAKSLQAVIASNTSLKAENDKLNRRITKLEKSLEKGIESVLTALDELSTQPAHMRKSVGSINVHDKDFNKSVNGEGTNDFDSLSKGQVMTILNNELYAGNSMVQPSDIISYESGAPLRPELKTLVVNKSK